MDFAWWTRAGVDIPSVEEGAGFMREHGSLVDSKLAVAGSMPCEERHERRRLVGRAQYKAVAKLLLVVRNY